MSSILHIFDRFYEYAEPLIRSIWWTIDLVLFWCLTVGLFVLYALCLVGGGSFALLLIARVAISSVIHLPVYFKAAYYYVKSIVCAFFRMQWGVDFCRRLACVLTGRVYEQKTIVTDRIRQYVQQKKVSGVLFLTGTWGCGKTYLIRHFKNVPCFVYGRTQCYVSLFGAHDEDDITNRILYAAFWTSRGSLLLHLFFISLTMGLLTIGFQRLKEPMLFIGGCYSVFLAIYLAAKLLMRRWFVNWCLKCRYVVFDDMERAHMESDRIFAYAGQLIDESNVPVIIVCNERQISGDRVANENAKEKVLETVLKLEHNAGEDIKIGISIIESLPDFSSGTFMKRYLKENCEEISRCIFEPLKEMHIVSEKQGEDEQQGQQVQQNHNMDTVRLDTNFRCFIRCIVELQYCFDYPWAESFYTTNKREFSEIIISFLRIRYYLGLTELPDSMKMTLEDVGKALINPMQYLEVGKNLFPILRVYPNLTTSVKALDVDVWRKLVLTGYESPDKIKESLNDFVKNTLSLASRWGRKWDNEEQIEKLYKETIDAFKGETVFSFDEFLNIVDGVLLTYDRINVLRDKEILNDFRILLSKQGRIDFRELMNGNRVIKFELENRLAFFSHRFTYIYDGTSSLMEGILSMIKENAFLTVDPKSSFENMLVLIGKLSDDASWDTNFEEWKNWWEVLRNYEVDFYPNGDTSAEKLFNALNAITNVEHLEKILASLRYRFNYFDDRKITDQEKVFWRKFVECIKNGHSIDVCHNWSDYAWKICHDYLEKQLETQRINVANMPKKIPIPPA